MGTKVLRHQIPTSSLSAQCTTQGLVDDSISFCYDVTLVLIADNFRSIREAWRYTGPFTRRNRFKGTLPGLGIGAGAFGLYLVYEQLFLKDDHHGAQHGQEQHGKDGH